MKVKEITLKEAEITTKPMPGATELDVNGKSVGVAHDAQTAQMISQAAKDGKLSLGQTPDGTQPGQQTPQLGEEPANSTNTYYVDNSTGTLIAKTSPKPTAIVASKLWQALTPEIIAKAGAQGFRPVNLSLGGPGNTVQGLEGGDQKLGSKIIVSPNDHAKLMGTRTAKESVELDAIRKLSGL